MLNLNKKQLEKLYKTRSAVNTYIINYLLKNKIHFSCCDSIHQKIITFYNYDDAITTLKYLFKNKRQYYYFINSYYKRFSNKKDQSYKSKIMKNYDLITDEIKNYYIYF